MKEKKFKVQVVHGMGMYTAAEKCGQATAMKTAEMCRHMLVLGKGTAQVSVTQGNHVVEVWNIDNGLAHIAVLNWGKE